MYGTFFADKISLATSICLPPFMLPAGPPIWFNRTCSFIIIIVCTCMYAFGLPMASKWLNQRVSSFRSHGLGGIYWICCDHRYLFTICKQLCSFSFEPVLSSIKSHILFSQISNRSQGDFTLNLNWKLKLKKYNRYGCPWKNHFSSYFFFFVSSNKTFTYLLSPFQFLSIFVPTRGNPIVFTIASTIVHSGLNCHPAPLNQKIKICMQKKK